MTWRLTAQRAQLTHGDLRGEIDLWRASWGLHDIHIGGTAYPPHQVLGLAIEELTSDTSVTLVDHYSRGADLVATYAQTAARQIRVQAYWRAVTLNIIGQPLAAIDLQVSAQTDLLGIDPAMSAITDLPSAAAYRVSHGGRNLLEPLLPGAAVATSIHSGCVLFRFAGESLSYAEMIHPTDLHRDEVTVAQSGCRLEHHLFAPPLEKGVILRARLRGLYMPRHNDQELATAAYAELAAMPPPLTT